MREIELGFVQRNSITFPLPSFPMIGVTGTLNDDNTIKMELREVSIDERRGFYTLLKEATKNKMKPLYYATIYAIVLIWGIISSILFPIRANCMAFAWVIVDVMYHYSFAKYILGIIEAYKNPDLKKMKGLHAAMHMCFNAYKSLGRVPTIKETRKFSMYTKNCSCSIRGRGFFMISISCIAGSLVPTMRDTNEILEVIGAAIFLIVMLISMIGSMYLSQKGWNKYISFYTLKKPTDTEINLAITVIKKVEEVESEPVKNLQEKYGTIMPKNFTDLVQACVWFSIVFDDFKD